MLFGKYLENKLTHDEVPEGKIQCEICGKVVNRKYYTRHKKTKYCSRMKELMKKLRDVVVQEFTGF